MTRHARQPKGARRKPASVVLGSFLLALTAGLLAERALAAQDLTAAYREGLTALSDDDARAAVPHFRRALDLAERQYGVDDPRTTVELNNLGEVLRLVGENEQAAAYLRRALAIERDHGTGVSAATTMNNLALVYRSSNRLAEAERLYKEALPLLENSLGPYHPDVAKNLNNLAMSYAAQGHYDKALPVLRRAVTVSVRAVGEDHPTTKLLARNERMIEQSAVEPLSTNERAGADENRALVQSEPASRLKGRHFPVLRPSRNVGDFSEVARATPWALHLASVQDRDSLADTWERLQHSFSELRGLALNDTIAVEVAERGTFYQVLAGDFAQREDGQAICDQLEMVGQYCRVVR